MEIKSIEVKYITGNLFLGIVVISLITYWQLSALLIATVSILTVITASYGLKPFGDTIAYLILQAAGFFVLGIVTLLATESTLPALALVIASLAGLLVYAKQGIQCGIWTRRNP
ncbi:hypothetical protein [Haloterrigena salifodinae]|uniref:hypothetical protein n=1 Tax=Haloterrigena salifodinae TaxID=2675099 RepID=UPI000F881102|nr:hypothetical protein [Haloterrigena salifodinae]